jgi:AraC family transcriptional regulator of adaptative response/methylated-DNA-[protein]-cysteine methyltransferase
MSTYERIAQAIDFITAHADEQPGLDAIAAHVHLSPYHFQRLFRRWAGVTPKRFLQVLTLEHAKSLLQGPPMPLLEVAEAVGLSSGSRLYDHFVQLEAVTPAEYRDVGRGLAIRHGRAASPFGDVFVATTARGICALAFLDADARPSAPGPFERLRRDWPDAALVENDAEARRVAARVFAAAPEGATPLSVLVRGTNFQVHVWRALLGIAPGRLASYGDVAAAIGRPSAHRAVGAAVGANPVAFVIPCHRVIRESGGIGGYRWGLTRKHALHAWEAARYD